MEKINTYEQYAKALADFKGEGGRCSSNKMLTKDEITTLAESGKLFYEITDYTFWLFEDDGYFYTGIFYVKKGSAISMKKQDKDVLTELMGNETRYDQQWEDELIAAEYEKWDKYFEYSCQLSDVIDDVKKNNSIIYKYIADLGLTYRYAKISDKAELFKLWETILGQNRYTVKSMTDKELEEMERENYCCIICEPDGKICASCVYVINKNIAYTYHLATYYKGSGIGASIYYKIISDIYERGCTKCSCWIREDNTESIKLHSHIDKPTGKFYRQFICRSK